jgi:hypothetical protein
VASLFDDLLERRAVIVMGKGGVGKTTISATLALEAARRGRKVLLCELAGSDALPELFGLAPTQSGAPREIRPGLFLQSLEPRRCLEQHVTRMLRSKTLGRLLFKNKLVDAFVDAMPGLDDVLVLDAVVNASDLERHPPAFDLAILDAPATGHGLTMLNTPGSLMEMLQTGPIFEVARKVHARLDDPSHCQHLVVTLGEALPVTEALELITKMERELSAPMPPVLVNMTHDARLDEPGLAALTEAFEGLEGAAPVLSALRTLQRQSEVNQEAQARLEQTLGRAVTTAPRLDALSRLGGGTKSLEELACLLKSS